MVSSWVVGVMLAYSVVSSANEARSAPAGTWSSQSFTYMRKRVGPSVVCNRKTKHSGRVTHDTVCTATL